jgi:hypothetical protein
MGKKPRVDYWKVKAAITARNESRALALLASAKVQLAAHIEQLAAAEFRAADAALVTVMTEAGLDPNGAQKFDDQAETITPGEKATS